MKLAWGADIHINFKHTTVGELARKLLKPVDAILVAGDIGTVAVDSDDWLRAFDDVDGKSTFFVLGNHDFYGSDISSQRRRAEWFGNETHNKVRHLNNQAIELTPNTLLVGHDGWYCGSAGDYEYSNVMLNDFHNIRDFVGKNKEMRLRIMRSLAEESAISVSAAIDRGLSVKEYDNVIILTHVPPWSRAHLGPDGNDGSVDFAPFFVNTYMGDMLYNKAMENPETKFLVLCGHTHTRVRVEMLINLQCRVAGAVYGKPALEGIVDTDNLFK